MPTATRFMEYWGMRVGMEGYCSTQMVAIMQWLATCESFCMKLSGKPQTCWNHSGSTFSSKAALAAHDTEPPPLSLSILIASIVYEKACCIHLAAEMAEILGVLADLHLLDDLTETRTIASTILPDNADLLRALGLQETT